MKNLLNIEDQVKINMPGTNAHGVTAEINSMQKWNDGAVHYIGKYHQTCPSGGEGYDNFVQFVDGQYTKLDKEFDSLREKITNLEKQLENVNDDRENKKQALLTLIAYNIKLFAEKDNKKLKEIKKEMNDFVSKITIDRVLG